MPAQAEETKGKITGVSADKNEFVLTADGKNLTFHHEKDGKVLINNKPGKLADLQVGDQAIVTYDKKGDRMICREVRTTRK
jgi:hypothetical protein